MSSVDDLVNWLRQQLDDDEQTALAAAEQVGDRRWQQRNARVVTVADRDVEVADYAIVECIDHITRQDPARVLADVDAKRRILDLVNGIYDERGIVKLLALPYADRPGYREEWKP